MVIKMNLYHLKHCSKISVKKERPTPTSQSLIALHDVTLILKCPVKGYHICLLFGLHEKRSFYFSSQETLTPIFNQSQKKN